MAQVSRFWGGTLTGDCGPYSNDEFNYIFHSLMSDGQTNAAVAIKYLNELVVTGAGSPVSVGTGAALVSGIWYENDAAVNVTFANAAPNNSRIDTVVLRASWALQTVRVQKLTGTETQGTPSQPALTQTLGLIWESPLAHLTINNAGLVSILDARRFAQMATMAKPIIAAMLF